jgi:CBS domain containing-hemolysin-like protein
MELVALLTSVLFFVLLEAFFSGSELVLVSVNEARLQRLAKRDRAIADFLKDKEGYITLTLFGYTFSIVIATTFYTFFWLKITRLYLPKLQGFEPLLAESLLVLTLVFGEILPKSLFLSNAEFLLPLIVKVLYPLKRFLKPLNSSVVYLRKVITSLFSSEERVFSREELIKMLLSGKVPLSKTKTHIVANILSFGERRISEIVKPLYSVVTVSEDATVERAIERIKRTGYSRIPVFASTLQDIVGYVQAYDLLKARKDEPVARYLRPIKVIGEFERLKDVMDRFIEEGEHIGIVVDERGIVIGIVTLEDIIEEITGELYERGKQEEEEIRRISPNRWIISGNLELKELKNLLNIDIPGGIYTSVAGFLQYKLGRLPRKGDVVREGNYIFKVIEADERKVKKVLLEKET